MRSGASRLLPHPVLPVLTHHLFTPRLKCHQRSPWMVGSRFLPGSFASTVDAGSLPRRLSAVNGVRSGRELFIRPLLRQPLHARSQSPAALRARAVYPPAPPSTSPRPFSITGSAPGASCLSARSSVNLSKPVPNHRQRHFTRIPPPPHPYPPLPQSPASRCL